MSLINTTFLKPHPCNPNDGKSIIEKIKNDRIIKDGGMVFSPYKIDYKNIDAKVRESSFKDRVYKIFSDCLINDSLYSNPNSPFMYEEILLGQYLYMEYDITSNLMKPYGLIDPYTLIRFVDRKVLFNKSQTEEIDTSINLLASILPNSKIKSDIVKNENDAQYWKSVVKRLNHIISVGHEDKNKIQYQESSNSYVDFFYNYKTLQWIQEAIEKEDNSRRWFGTFKGIYEYREYIKQTGKVVKRINFDYLLKQFCLTNGLVLFSSSRTPEMSVISYICRYLLAVLKVYQVSIERSIEIIYDYQSKFPKEGKNNKDLHLTEKVLGNIHYAFKPIDKKYDESDKNIQFTLVEK